MKVLDVGCGSDKLPGAVGIDRSASSAADVVHDLDDTPWPLPDREFDLVRCQDVLEHLDDLVRVMEEIHRVAKPGAEILIRVPHFSSVQAFTDVTHRHFFSTESFRPFSPADNPYPHYSSARFAMESCRIMPWKPYRWLGISWLANRFPLRYEKMFAFLFPSQYLEFRLRAVQGGNTVDAKERA
jgi:SAM-dependent methyltransferase